MATPSKKTKTAKRGRPPLPPEKRKRPSMGFRPTADLRGKLEHAAVTSGLSLTQEVERRLERSFAEEDSWAPAIADEAKRGIKESFGKEETFLLARLLADAIQIIEMKTGKNWMDDPDAHQQAQEACKTIFDSFRPPVGGRLVLTDLKSGGSVGADAAEEAMLSFFHRATKDAKIRMKKKGTAKEDG